MYLYIGMIKKEVRLNLDLSKVKALSVEDMEAVTNSLAKLANMSTVTLKLSENSKITPT